MRNVVSTLAEHDTAAPVTAVVQQLLHATMAAGRGEDDNSVMAKTVFELAGVEVGSGLGLGPWLWARESVATDSGFGCRIPDGGHVDATLTETMRAARSSRARCWLRRVHAAR